MDDNDRILDKLDDHTVKLTDLGSQMRMYMANQNELNSSLTKSMKELGSEVVRMKLTEAGAGHKCAEEIEKHEEKSWAHNQYKAGGIIVGVVGFVIGLFEFIKGLLKH